LIGLQFKILQIPAAALKGFEPSQIGTIIGVLMDACIPQLPLVLKDRDKATLETVGLRKHEGILKDREGYPDYLHASGKRAELKLIYIDPVGVEMKKPATAREPSARLTQKVTVKNVDPARDVLPVIAYRLEVDKEGGDLFAPTIIELGVFSMIECIRARDDRLIKSGGKWFGNYEVPAILSKQGRKKKKRGKKGKKKPVLDASSYGRNESERKDYNEDTNFGKLARVPYTPLQDFLKKFGATIEVHPEVADAIPATTESPIETAERAAHKADIAIQEQKGNSEPNRS
jgi:hypothetical protein